MAGKRIRKRAVKARLFLISDVDRRSAAFNRAIATKEAIIADLGGHDNLSTIEKLMCEHASLAAAVAEDSYIRWLKGDGITPAELGTTQNAFIRVAQALGISRRPKDITAQSIDSYLKETSIVREEEPERDRETTPEDTAELVGRENQKPT